MSERARWDLVGFDERAVRVEVREALSARALLGELLPSKPVVGRALARGQLLRDGVALHGETVLAPGEAAELRLWRQEGPHPCSTEPVTVVYQDPILMAVEKPAGLLVHGDGDGCAGDTLTARVQGLLASQGSPARAQAVQRLDRATTGLVLLSLTEEFQPALDAQLAGGGMRKRYLAVVEGVLAGSEAGWLELDGPIARDRHDARRMRVGRTGRSSLTRARTLAVAAGRSLLLVELGTGRRHQIRVHLAHAGRPLLGDVLYGGRPHAAGLMLHAWQERVEHPLTGERIQLRASWPERLAALGFAEVEPPGS